jgi:hypothetical protein
MKSKLPLGSFFYAIILHKEQFHGGFEVLIFIVFLINLLNISMA